MKHKFNFQFSPNLIILLGEQLIQDKKIALSELVKNAYDADASEVSVDIVDNAQIIITDDGCGMDIDTIQNIWLRPGISSKKNLAKSPIYRRYPIGEKGVGRLGSHKLGSSIEVYTKKEGHKEIHLKIDWQDIEQANDIESLEPIDVNENETAIYFKNNTGTRLIIKNLKEKWGNKDVEQLSRDLTNLVAPFSNLENFNIKIKRNNELFNNDLNEVVAWIKENALFKFNVVVDDGYIKEFTYSFSPWLGLDKLKYREITYKNDIELLEKIIGKNNNKISFNSKLEKYANLNLGEIRFEGFIYDFDNTLWLNQHQLNKGDKSTIKDYIRANGGIRVYKDNLRVFNYGEAGQDILELDLKRVNRPAGKISSNQILASIKLDRISSNGLIEKTNREGFINNESFDALQEVLDEVLAILSHFRQEDKSKINRILAKSENRTDIIHKIATIKDIIESSELEEYQKQKIKQNLEDFSTDFSNVRDILLSASNTGLNLTIVVHEVEKLITILLNSIKEKNWKKIDDNAKTLQQIVNNYKDIIKVDKTASIYSLSEIVEGSLFNCQARFNYHSIEIVKDINKELKVSVKKNLIMGVINNLLDNAIYWLNYQKIEKKKIYIKIYEQDNQVHLVIADNGLGFTLDFDVATQPFVTGRQDESSMGIGLYLANQIVTSHQGILALGNFKKEGLSDEFTHGAIIKLIFKQDKEG